MRARRRREHPRGEPAASAEELHRAPPAITFAGQLARAIVAVALCAPLLACSSKPQQRAEVPPAAEQPAPPPVESPRVTQLRPRAIEDIPEPPEPVIALPFRESFTVQSAGDEPRQRRRYALTAATRLYSVTAALEARAITGDAAPTAPAKVPPFRETFALEASATSPLQWRGDPIHVEGDASAAAPYVMRWKTLLSGRRARFSIDDRALPADLTFAEDPLRERSQPEIDELGQRLLGWIVPLPDEPIGVGARWTAVTVLRQGLGVVKQTARYHLVEVEAGADRLVLDVDVRRVAEEQRVKAPELPPGTTLELVALFRSVTGRLELSLQAPLPVAGKVSIEARSHQRLLRADAPTIEAISEDTGSLTLKSEPLR